ncbi:SusC/RagA family TonB-linked outer membrane protein [Maribellus comscasis]|uniref:SusC/RagA family TonB-linked outer membrane protein n=1 Tax=Maribellus comscasis TaxID=2681766 RepID=A0A6I6JWE9_9BACT|nr:TonB-dependent receptor [Maribellus comscasis]QGY46951.1 SusC/RagA family TonB-linked outer membrane protein [Maribellus comscasis]
MKKKLINRALPAQVRLKKFLLIMRLTILLCFTLISSLNASVYSQDAKLGLELKGKTISDAFEFIESNSNFRFFYNADFKDINKKIEFSTKDADIESMLKGLFADSNISYEIVGGNLIVLKVNSQQENLSVKGKVSDRDGIALPGVTVVVKGTIQGTVTNADGEYSISNIPKDATLLFSFVGMKTQEVKVDNQPQIDVVMHIDAIGIEEVVAVGYGSQKKINLTGSISQVDTETLQSSAVTNTSSALQGKTSGVTIRQNSGLAGEDNSSIKIRGIGTLNAGQNPLVLVDGVEMDINSVDPMDIENISILKDAASAAIYGSRAANGVILITTKDSRKNQPTSINYNSYYGIQQVTNIPDMMNAYEHAMLYNEALANDGISLYFSDDDLTKLQNAIYVDDINFPNNLSEAELADFHANGYYQNVDYKKMSFRAAPLQKHYLSVEGGGENSYGRVGIGYTNQEGILIGNEAETYNIKMNYDASLLDDRIRFYSKLFYYRNEYDSGSNRWHVPGWYGYYFPNDMYNSEAPTLALGAHDKTTQNQVVGLLGTKLSLVKNLDITVEYSQVRNFDKQDEFTPARYTYNFWETTEGYEISELSLESSESMKQTGTATAVYSFDFTENSELAILGGTSFESYIYKMFGASRQELLNNFQPELNLGSSATMANWAGATEYALSSFFGRVNYNYSDRYLLEMNVRLDGSSRFSSGNQWGVFPSASFGWRISEENFMKDASNIDNLKLRLSYGQLGNQNIDNYAARDLLVADENTSYPVDDELETTIGIGSLANTDISWETTTMGNVGIDLNMYEQFNVSLDLYKKISSDVLYRIAIPATVGVQQGPYRNIAEVQNVGWDFTFGWNRRFSNGLQLGANLNVSGYKNEITSLNNNGAPVYPGDKDYYIWQEGQPIDAYYGYRIGGIATQEQIDGGLIPEQDLNITAGDLWTKDISGDGEITDEDREIIGDPHPDFIYSLNLSVRWKNFDFSLLLEGVQGMEEILYGSMWQSSFRSLAVNKPTFLLDRWTPENQTAKYPKVRSLDSQVRMSDFYVEDASYLRGKDLTFGYTLPKSVLHSIGLKHVRIYANFRNLFILTGFKGLDPETNDFDDTSKQGVVPPSKTYTFGLQVQI